MRCTCGGYLDSMFALCLARRESLPGDAIYFCRASGFSACIVFYMGCGSASGCDLHLQRVWIQDLHCVLCGLRLSQVMRPTCGECLDAMFVLCCMLALCQLMRFSCGGCLDSTFALYFA